MFTFNDAARVSRQIERTSLKLQSKHSRPSSLVQGKVNSNKSKTGRVSEPEVNRIGVHGRHASLIQSKVKRNDFGDKQIENKPERIGINSNGHNVYFHDGQSVSGSRLVHTQGGNSVIQVDVSNLSHNKRDLVQSRNGKKEGIDPGYFGMSVKPKSFSVKSKTSSTLRLPTAGTGIDNFNSGFEPEGELHGYNEEEDNSEAYSPEHLDFMAKQRQQQKETKNEPRVEIYGGAEPCSCFPHRSDKNLPSMVYEKLKCKHSHVKGEAHAGVYRFNSNWNDQYEDSEKKKSSEPPPKTKFVFGYPKPTFLEIPGTTGTYDNGDDFYEGEDYEGDKYWDYYKNNDISERYTDRQDGDEFSNYQKDERNSLKQIRNANKKKKTDDFVSGLLPQIGYSPPPSRDKSRLSVRSRPYSLPQLPDSPYLSVDSVQRIKSVQSIRSNGDYANGTRYDSPLRSRGKQDVTMPMLTQKAFNRNLDTPRRFKGKYYDSVLNKTLNYDILPKYQKDTNEWRAYVGEGTAGSRRGSRESRMPSKSFKGSGNRRRSVQIPEEDDADDDYYEDDEDSG